MMVKQKTAILVFFKTTTIQIQPITISLGALLMFDVLLYNAEVFHHGAFYKHHGIAIKDGVITMIAPDKELNSLQAKERINIQGEFLVPGYIDLHTHGLHDHLIDNGQNDIEAITKELPQYGTTSFLPTIIPHPQSEEIEFLTDAAKTNSLGSEILGFFIEGPFLAKTGAILPSALDNRTPQRVRDIIAALAPHRVIFAISPEIDDLDTVMEEMTKPIFITHTQAGVTDTLDAISRGACHATHFYDVFYAPEETDPGVRPCGAVEAILADPSVSVDFILDGEHVDPIAVKVALACKPVEKICLITDANIGAGYPPGVYRGFGDDEIRFNYPGGPARGTQNSHSPGTLYGSGLTMDKAVKNVLRFNIAPLESAITMASTSPAKVLGVYGKKGDLAVGFDADILRLTDDLDVKTTWIQGKIKFDKS